MYSVSHFTLLESRAQVFRSRLCVSREEDDEETREYFLSVCLSLSHTHTRARTRIDLMKSFNIKRAFAFSSKDFCNVLNKKYSKIHLSSHFQKCR